MVEKLVPKLRFNEFHDEWNTIFLNSILSFKNGFNASKDQYGFGTKFINVSDILENNYLTYDNIQDYVNVNDSEFTNYIIEYGDIVFQRSSENREEVGTANVYLGSQPCVYGGFVIRGKKEGNYNPFFLKELLQSTRVRKEITSWSGGSTRYNVGQDSLNKISIILPSIEEQNKIADLLLNIYEKIDLLEYKYQSYKNFKKYLMQQIFTQKLRFNDNCHYKTKKVKDFLIESKIEGIDDINKRLTVKLNLKGITIRESKTIEIEGATKQFIRKSGQFIYGKQNLHKGAFGIVPKELDGYLTSSDIPSFDFKGEIEPKWFYYYFSRKSFYEKLESLSTGTGSKRISPKEFLNIKIIVPEIEEQHRIVYLLEKFDEKINGISNQIVEMDMFKKSLLQQMFI